MSANTTTCRERADIATASGSGRINQLSRDALLLVHQALTPGRLEKMHSLSHVVLLRHRMYVHSTPFSQRLTGLLAELPKQGLVLTQE